MDGNLRQVQVLHLGRVSLVARSLDGTKSWVWDQLQNQWLQLDSSIKPDLDKAFNVATKQAAPSLLTLPLSQTLESK